MKLPTSVLLMAILAMLPFALPAAAQEFSFDAEAMSKILAETHALKVKHDGRPVPPFVGDYEARHIAFKLLKTGSGRDGAVYVNKAIEIFYKDSILATLELNDDPRGWADARRVLEAFEHLRRDAMDQKRRIVINYDAIQRQNKADAWSMPRNPKECELFDKIIRLGLPPFGH